GRDGGRQGDGNGQLAGSAGSQRCDGCGGEDDIVVVALGAVADQEDLGVEITGGDFSEVVGIEGDVEACTDGEGVARGDGDVVGDGVGFRGAGQDLNVHVVVVAILGARSVDSEDVGGGGRGDEACDALVISGVVAAESLRSGCIEQGSGQAAFAGFEVGGDDEAF